MKKYIRYRSGLIGLLLSIPFITIAQEETVEIPREFAPHLSEWLFFGVVFMVILAALFAVYKVMELMIRMRELKIYEKHGLEDYIAEKEANKGPWWQRFSRKMTDVVPVAQEKDILLEHSYDGIRELDNNLPPWWLYGFYVSIAFGIFYIIFFHFSPYAKSSTQEYEIEMAEAAVQVENYLSTQADAIDETNVTFLTDEASLSAGKEIFNVQCIACHLEHGGGNEFSVGPNLTDEYWVHGGSIKDVFTTVKYGVPEKGMIAWNTQLRPVEMHQVSSYILSLQGTNPPGAKAPQGELYVPGSEATVDSVSNTGID